VSKPDSIAFKYVGKAGEFFGGVPKRDLTHAQFERLGPIEKVNVRESAFYKAVEEPKDEKPKSDDKPSGA